MKENNDKIQFDKLKECQIVLALKEKSIGDKLKMAEKLAKEKGSALEFLESSVYGLNEMLIENVKVSQNSKDIKRDLAIIQEFYNSIKNTNVNLRLALENLFLQI